MYLSALTLKGFKSFASATTLRFERGMTCVVGPNGSGKSNVVDAISWVLGEQGARTLRGGSMADVIFAGTAARAPLGRAEVSLTFDNSDGAIPEAAAEVTVTRTMFRSGGSDYAVNGRACRLLDIQEMLGDAGIGREMHVLVGQGRVDAVLTATPQERRLFLEEAAGVAKHRRRKEKALRKLAAMDGNLVRLADLTSEVARQLKPLGRQARTARRARRHAADARDARLRLLADDASAATAALAALDPADGVTAAQRLERVEADLARAEAGRAAAGTAAAAAAPAVTAWREAAGRGVAVHDRLQATLRLADDRIGLLRTHLAERTAGAADPEQAAADQAGADARAGALAAEVAAQSAVVTEAAGLRARADAAHAAAERAAAEGARARSRSRDQVARLEREVSGARARVEAAEAERTRAEGALAQARERRGSVHEAPAGDTGEGAAATDGAAESAGAALAAADADLAARTAAARDAAAVRRGLEEAERAADRERAAAAARADALLRLAAPADASAFVTGRREGARLLSSALQVRRGSEAAVAAALGAAVDAVVLDDLGAAVDALDEVAGAGAGRVGIVVPGGDGASGPAWRGPAVPALPTGVSGMAGEVGGEGAVADWARSRLAATVLVPDLEAARGVVAADPHLVAVTPGGDVVRRDEVHGGAPPAATSLERAAAQAAAGEEAAAAGRRWQSARDAADEARATSDAAEGALDEARGARAAAAAALAAVDRARAARAARVQAADADVTRAQAALDQAVRRHGELAADAERRAEALDAALVEAAAAAAGGEVHGAGDLAGLAAAAHAAREAETSARLSMRTLEERAAGARREAAAAQAAAVAARAAADAARAREAGARASLEAALAVRGEAAAAATSAVRVREAALAGLGVHQDAHGTASAAYAAATAEVDALAAERARLAEAAHAEELARTQHRLRLDGLAETAARDFGHTLADLVEQFGPHVPVPEAPEGDDDGAGPTAAQPAGDGEAAADAAGAGTVRTRGYERGEQERRLRAAEQALAQLGTINPLAVEEYAALEARHRFLLQQQQDLSDSKRDLLAIIKDVDERVEQVVAEAFLDTAGHFADIVARLFPGGTGRLVLTDPDDLLTAGIEVEARPAGKTVKRLSLLSGGERTLVALAFLVALFRARPSPFYVLDEIEAALDDTNLGRLLVVLAELRETSQLVVVTHQRRTMEAADVLHGVTMRGDGISTVVTQQVSEAAGTG